MRQTEALAIQAMTLASRIVVRTRGGIAQAGFSVALYQRADSVSVAQVIGHRLRGQTLSMPPPAMTAPAEKLHLFAEGALLRG
jgi:ABC-type sulfate/molybdate transport systems ATPase subunit